MLDQLVKITIAGIAAYAADRFVKNKTGKHIHEHAVDFVKKLWTRLRRWASAYLSEHESARKVYLSAVSVAASIKRARNDGVKYFRLKVFAQEDGVPKPRVIKEETVTLDEADAVLETAKKEAVLAYRN